MTTIKLCIRRDVARHELEEVYLTPLGDLIVSTTNYKLK